MGRPSLLFILLTMSSSTLGSLIQTSRLQDNSDSVQINQNADKNIDATDSLSREVTFHSVSGSDVAEGSAHSVDSRTSQINNTVIPKESERASTENTSESGVTLTTTPDRTLYHLKAHDQEADEANTSITGHAHASVLISEDALLEGSHTSTEDQLKVGQASTVNDVLMNGK